MTRKNATLREIAPADLAKVQGGASKPGSDISIKGSDISIKGSDIYVKFGDISGEAP